MIFFQDNSEIALDFTRLAQKQTVACQKSNLHYLKLASGHLKWQMAPCLSSAACGTKLNVNTTGM